MTQFQRLESTLAPLAMVRQKIMVAEACSRGHSLHDSKEAEKKRRERRDRALKG